MWRNAAGSAFTCLSAAAVPGVVGQPLWTRAEVDITVTDTVVTFLTSTDGSAWTPNGSPCTVPTTTRHAGGAPIRVGYIDGAFALGDIYDGQLREGINGTLRARMNAEDGTPPATSWTSSSTGETWTVNQSGGSPAVLTSGLSVPSVYGLPPGGTETLSGTTVTYAFTATAAAAGTPFLIAIDGFTNTATPGTYTSSVTTYDNAATPAIVDGPTASNPVLFDDNSTDVRAPLQGR